MHFIFIFIKSICLDYFYSEALTHAKSSWRNTFTCSYSPMWNGNAMDQGCAKLTDFDWIFDFGCENFRNFRFWCWFWRATTLFEIFDFDFEQDFATSKLLVAISKYNLKLSTFSDIFEQWHAGKMGLWCHCYLIRIF